MLILKALLQTMSLRRGQSIPVINKLSLRLDERATVWSNISKRATRAARTPLEQAWGCGWKGEEVEDEKIHSACTRAVVSRVEYEFRRLFRYIEKNVNVEYEEVCLTAFKQVMSEWAHYTDWLSKRYRHWLRTGDSIRFTEGHLELGKAAVKQIAEKAEKHEKEKDIAIEQLKDLRRRYQREVDFLRSNLPTKFKKEMEDPRNVTFLGVDNGDNAPERLWAKIVGLQEKVQEQESEIHRLLEQQEDMLASKEALYADKMKRLEDQLQGGANKIKAEKRLMAEQMGMILADKEASQVHRVEGGIELTKRVELRASKGDILDLKESLRKFEIHVAKLEGQVGKRGMKEEADVGILEPEKVETANKICQADLREPTKKEFGVDEETENLLRDLREKIRSLENEKMEKMAEEASASAATLALKNRLKRSENDLFEAHERVERLQEELEEERRRYSKVAKWMDFAEMWDAMKQKRQPWRDMEELMDELSSFRKKVKDLKQVVAEQRLNLKRLETELRESKMKLGEPMEGDEEEKEAKKENEEQSSSSSSSSEGIPPWMQRQARNRRFERRYRNVQITDLVLTAGKKNQVGIKSVEEAAAGLPPPPRGAPSSSEPSRPTSTGASTRPQTREKDGKRRTQMPRGVDPSALQQFVMERRQSLRMGHSGGGGEAGIGGRSGLQTLLPPGGEDRRASLRSRGSVQEGPQVDPRERRQVRLPPQEPLQHFPAPSAADRRTDEFFYEEPGTESNFMGLSRPPSRPVDATPARGVLPPTPHVHLPQVIPVEEGPSPADEGVQVEEEEDLEFEERAEELPQRAGTGVLAQSPRFSNQTNKKVRRLIDRGPPGKKG